MQYTNLKDGLMDLILGKNDIFFSLNNKETGSLIRDVLSFCKKTFNINYEYVFPENAEYFLKHKLNEIDPTKIYLVNSFYPSLSKFFYYKSINKKYPNIKFKINYDLNELNYYYLNNLDEFKEIHNHSYFYSEKNLINFNSFEDFLEYSSKFKKYSIEDCIKNISSLVIKNKININLFNYYFNFICLNEEDCISWHKFLCKEVFKIPYTDFENFYMNLRYIKNVFFIEEPVYKQSADFILFNNYKVNFFNRNSSFDTELKKLFNYHNLDFCCFPNYLNLLVNLKKKNHSYLDSAFIGINQLKVFYKTYPEYFSYLIYTLENKFGNSLTIVG